MSLFLETICEWTATSLDEVLDLIEGEKLELEPGVQDYDKFHGAVKKAQQGIRHYHKLLHHPDKMFKSRIDKQDQMRAHHKRLGKIMQATRMAGDFANKVGAGSDHAEHDDEHERLAQMRNNMTLEVPGAKNRQRGGGRRMGGR